MRLGEVVRKAMWILQSADSDGQTTFRVGVGAVKTVGRAPRADFVLDAALVSRLHCRLEATEQALEVVDLSSTNGTFVNGKRVARARLAAGDRLRVGRVELTVGRGPSGAGGAGEAGRAGKAGRRELPP